MNYTKLLPQPQRFESWQDWLNKVKSYLVEIGYKKYFQQHDYSTFQYFKKIDKKYQIAVLFYDSTPEMIGIQFECHPLDFDFAINLVVCKDIDILEFEKMANQFYLIMEKYR